MIRPIVVLGDVMTDVVAAFSRPLAHASDTDARTRVGGGGSAANVAAWLAAAGARVALVARVGADELGRARCAELAAAGVELRVAVDPDQPTGVCVVLVGPDGERTMLPDRGANLALEPADVPVDLLAEAAHLHVSGYALLHDGPRAAARHALTAARAHGIGTSVSAASAAPLRAVGVEAFREWTAGVEMLVANAAEAELFAPTPGYPELVVTAGPAGATWAWAGGRVTQPAVSTDVVDTTGAGDAFIAGLLASWVGGASRQAALAAGAALAAQAVSRPGARPEQSALHRPSADRQSGQ